MDIHKLCVVFRFLKVFILWTWLWFVIKLEFNIEVKENKLAFRFGLSRAGH
jgi:hypothetical protein